MNRRNRPTLDADLVPGDLRLLHDLAVVARVIDGDCPAPARTRLDRVLGERFADEVRRSLADTMARAA
ncbi:MAG: hypothetical protein ACM3QU_03685 [Verrucomicrobiota bacterium]